MPSASAGKESPAREESNAFSPDAVAKRTAVIYAVVSVVWIALSDRLVAALVDDRQLAATVSMIKGWSFVAVTAVMFYALIRAQLRRWESETRERARAVEALETKKRQLASALTMTNSGYWEYDVAARSFTFNDHMYGLLRTTAEREGGYAMSSSLFARRFLPRDEVTLIAAEVQRVVETNDPNYVRELEHRLVRKDGSIAHIATRIFIAKDLHGRTTTAFGVSQNITDRIRANEAARVSQTLYRSLVDTIPAAVFRKDAEGRFVFVNGRFCEVADYGPEMFLGRTAQEVAKNLSARGRDADHDAAQTLQFYQGADHHQMIMQTGRTIELEEEWCAPDGSRRYFHVVKTPVHDGGGVIVGSQGARFEITDRKRTEARLMASEQQLRIVTENARLGLIMVDHDRRYVYANQTYADILGRPLSEIVGRPMVDVLGAEVFEGRVRGPLESALAGQFASYETTRDTPIGERYYAISYQPQWTDGGVTQVVCVLVDITERKRAEQALRENEERLRSLGDNLPDSYVYQYKRGPDGRPQFIYLSAGAAKVHGISVADALRDGAVLRRQIAPEDLPAVDAREEASLAAMSDFEMELRFTRADGAARWMHLLSRPRRTLEGEVVWDGVAADITVRKRAAEALELSRAIISRSIDGVHVVDPATRRFIEVNENACQALGYTREELLQLTVSDVAPEIDSATFVRVEATLRTAGHVTRETSHRRKDGTTYPIEVSLFNVRLGRDYIVAFVRDITNRKMAEAAVRVRDQLLHAADRRLAEIMNGMTEACFALGNDWRFTFVNDRGETLLRHKREAMLGHSIWDVFQKLVGTPMEKNYRRVMAERVPMAFEAFSPIAERWLDIRLFPSGDGLAAFLMDITDRKEAAEKLREVEERFSAAFRSSPAAIAISRRRDMVNLEVNDAFLRLHECTREQVVGHAMSELGLLDEETAAALARQLRSTGEVTNLEIVARTFTGRRINVSTSIREIQLGGEVCALSTIVDITERKRAEAALAEERNLLRTLFDLLPDYIYVKDSESRFIASNGRSAARFSPDSQGSLIGKTDADLFPPEAANRFRAEELSVLQGVPLVDREETLQRPDGTRETILTTKVPLRDDTGKIIGLVGCGHDITNRKRNEEALRESEEKFSSAFRSSPSAIAITRRRDMANLEVNDSFLRIFEGARDEIIGHTLTELNLLEPAVMRSLKERLDATGEVRDAELSGRTLRGRSIQIIVSIRVIQLGGEPCALTSVVDITESKRTVAALSLSEERFRQMATTIDEVFWMADVGLNEIVYVSPAYEQLWGRTCASLIANPRSFIESIHPDDRDRVLAGFALQADGLEFDHEYRIVRPDGEIRHIWDRGYPVRPADGKVTHYVGVAQDLTARKKLEEQFYRAQRMEAIGTLSSGIAHDLNNILAPILMAPSMLREVVQTEHQAQMLDLIEQSARRGSGIIKQLLTFSRGSGGERVLVQVRHVLREMQAIVTETFPREITLRRDFAANLLPVLGDATQLHQVLLNLCVNARDAMPAGGTITLRGQNTNVGADEVKRHPAATPGAYVLITVEDTGEGIAPENLDRIFEPFFTTKEVGKGTGLGLSTVAGIVRSHGGFIEVTSTLGRGSCFSVYLPVAPSEAPKTSSPGIVRAGRGRGELVLVVDDEPFVLQSTRFVLERYGYRVVTAANGEEALVAFQAGAAGISLVLTDVMMPGMNGVVLISALRQLQSNLKIMATTGMSSESKHSELAALGITSILQKPLSAEELLSAIDREFAAV